jgi:hypothetical protein
MKSIGSAVLLSAQVAFCLNGVAFGQAPDQNLGAREPLSDEGRVAAETLVARAGGDASVLQRPQPGQSNPLWAIPFPLFSPTRRPPPPVVAEAPKVSAPVSAPPPAPPEMPQVTLVGAVHGAGLDLAVLVDETDKSLVRLRVGQSVRGWTVHGLDARAAMIEKAQQQVKLELPTRSVEAAARAPTPAETVAAAAALDQ